MERCIVTLVLHVDFDIHERFVIFVGVDTHKGVDKYDRTPIPLFVMGHYGIWSRLNASTKPVLPF